MSGVSIRFTFDRQEFRRMTETGTIAQATWRAAGKVRDDAKREITSQGLVDTGKMRQSVVARRVRKGRPGVWYEIGSELPYAYFQHEGTRDHGPVRARLLRFKPKGSGVYVFARRVRGVRATKFLTRALARLTPGDFHA
jgi:hypothetical protein